MCFQVGTMKNYVVTYQLFGTYPKHMILVQLVYSQFHNWIEIHSPQTALYHVFLQLSKTARDNSSNMAEDKKIKEQIKFM